MRSRVFATVLSGAGLLLLAVLVFMAYNRRSLDVDALESGLEQWISHTRRAGRLADAGILSTPEAPTRSPVLRLEDRLGEARCEPRGGFRPLGEAPAGPLNLDFSPADGVGWVAELGQGQLRDGVLGLRGQPLAQVGTRNLPPVPASTVGAIELVLRSPEGGWLEIGLSRSADAEWPDRWGDDRLRLIQVHLRADSEFRTYRIRTAQILRHHVTPGDRIRKIFLRASSPPLFVDSLSFLPRIHPYLEQACGAGYEDAAGEMRRVLYTWSGAQLEFDLLVPETSPVLSFGAAPLLPEAELELHVRLQAADRSTVLLSEGLQGAPGWRDHRFDLSPWRGQPVTLSLSSRGQGQNVALWSSPVLYPTAARRRHLFLVVEDSLRADHLSAYGYERATSPVKEVLAEGGVLFERAFSQATKTRPSIPSMFTSLLPSVTGVWSSEHRLAETYTTLAEVLRDAGFATALFSQNANAGIDSGTHQGFDSLFDDLDSIGPRAEDLYGQPLRRWLDRHSDRDLFVYLHAIDPHWAYEPRPPYDEWYQALEGSGTPVERNPLLDPESVGNPTIEDRRARYDGEIRDNDHWLGELLHELDVRRIRQDALIVFTSDHGEFLGEHDTWGHHQPSFREVIHVPLILSYPEVLPAGLRISQPAQLLDIMPTALDLLGVDFDARRLQGRSLVPLIRGEDRTAWQQRVVVSDEVHLASGEDSRAWGSLIFGDWHVLNSPSFFLRTKRRDPELREWLYVRFFNRHHDPAETDFQNLLYYDLPLKHRINARLRELLTANRELRSALGGRPADIVDYNPEATDQLRALGYLQ